MNALKHGHRSQATIREYQRIRYVLRLAAWNIERVRLLIRLRDAAQRIKYKFLPLVRERARTSPPFTGVEGRSAATKLLQARARP